MSERAHSYGVSLTAFPGRPDSINNRIELTFYDKDRKALASMLLRKPAIMELHKVLTEVLDQMGGSKQ